MAVRYVIERAAMAFRTLLELLARFVELFEGDTFDPVEIAHGYYALAMGGHKQTLDVRTSDIILDARKDFAVERNSGDRAPATHKRLLVGSDMETGKQVSAFEMLLAGMIPEGLILMGFFGRHGLA